jgi:hypothetical protein
MPAYFVPFSQRHLTSERSALAIALSLPRRVEKLQLIPRLNPRLIAWPFRLATVWIIDP